MPQNLSTQGKTTRSQPVLEVPSHRPTGNQAETDAATSANPFIGSSLEGVYGPSEEPSSAADTVADTVTPGSVATDASRTSPLPELTDSYANSLIDEVFKEVDHMLESGVAVLDGDDSQRRRAVPAPRPDQLEHHRQDVDETGLVPFDRPSSQANADGGSADGMLAAAGAFDADASAAANSDAAAPLPGRPAGLASILVNLLPILVACTSLGIALSAGLALYSQRQQLADTTATPDAATSPADAEFLAYMEQALEVISQKEEAGEPGAIASESATAEASAADEGSRRHDSPSSGLVAPLPMPIYQPPPAISALPTVPLQEPLTPPPAPPSPTQATPPPADFPAAPPSPAPEPTPDPEPTPAPAPPPNVAPAATHTLVGLLQLGDRSAAIFEFAGTAQRIAVGERIGSSEWSLVSVSNDEAIIRRNGEVRSIYIGQSF